MNYFLWLSVGLCVDEVRLSCRSTRVFSVTFVTRSSSRSNASVHVIFVQGSNEVIQRVRI